MVKYEERYKRGDSFLTEDDSKLLESVTREDYLAAAKRYEAEFGKQSMLVIDIGNNLFKNSSYTPDGVKIEQPAFPNLLAPEQPLTRERSVSPPDSNVPTTPVRSDIQHTDTAVKYSDSAPGSNGRGWQFRIAIDPDPANMDKAAEVLERVFQAKKRDLSYKILMQSASSTDWDGTQKDSRDTDRDQRGKEVCVDMRFDKKRGQEMSPKEWKKLMLEAWSELQKAGVKMGSLSPPHGDRTVPSSEGILTPFSYTSNKPYDNRHGILFEDNYNPNNYPDPLKGMIITKADLKKYEIYQSKYKQQLQEKVKSQHQHAANAEARIVGDINNIVPASDISSEFFAQTEAFLSTVITADLSRQRELVTEYAIAFRTFESSYPQITSSRLDIIPEFTPLRKAVTNFELEVKTGRLLSERWLTELREELPRFKESHARNYENSIAEIIKDYKDSPQAMAFLGRNNLQNDLENLVRSNPHKMQVLFRQIIHVERENQAIVNAEKQLGNPVKAQPDEAEARAEALQEAFEELLHNKSENGIKTVQMLRTIAELTLECRDVMKEISTGVKPNPMLSSSEAKEREKEILEIMRKQYNDNISPDSLEAGIKYMRGEIERYKKNLANGETSILGERDRPHYLSVLGHLRTKWSVYLKDESWLPEYSPRSGVHDIERFLDKQGQSFPSEMIVDIANSSMSQLRLIFSRPQLLSKLSTDDLLKIHQHYQEEYISNKAQYNVDANYDIKQKIDTFENLEKEIVSNVDIAKKVLQNPDIMLNMTKENFMHMIGQHKNDQEFCELLMSQRKQLPDHLKLSVLRNDENFRMIAGESERLPEYLSKKSLWMAVKNLVQESKDRKDSEQDVKDEKEQSKSWKEKVQGFLDSFPEFEILQKKERHQKKQYSFIVRERETNSNKESYTDFDKDFWNKYREVLLQDPVISRLTDNGTDRTTTKMLHKINWLEKNANNLPTELLVDLAISKPFFAKIVLVNPITSSKLTVDNVVNIHQALFIKSTSYPEFASAQRAMLGHAAFAKHVLSDQEILRRMSTKNFLHMLDMHKNDKEFCAKLLANQDKLPERLQFSELKKDDIFKQIIKKSPHLDQSIGRTVLQQLHLIDRIAAQQSDRGTAQQSAAHQEHRSKH